MKCPYCGAETMSRKCEYCNSDLSEQYMNNGTIGGAVSGAINNIGQSIANNISNIPNNMNRNNNFQNPTPPPQNNFPNNYPNNYPNSYPNQNMNNPQPNFVQNIIIGGQPQQQVRPDVSPKSKNTALILCIIGFFGVGGLHRFYTGHILSGILWLCTGGLGYIGTIIDLIMILSNSFKDKNELKLLSEDDS